MRGTGDPDPSISEAVDPSGLRTPVLPVPRCSQSGIDPPVVSGFSHCGGELMAST